MTQASRSAAAWYGEVRRYLPLPRLLLAAALLVATVLTRLTPGTLDLDPAVRPLGLSFVAAGMALVAWALWTLDVGMLGGVEPLAPALVVTGPYRLVRHPVYVGMTVSMVAYPLAAGSLPGLLAAALLVIPAIAYRAAREEAALARRFGAEWTAYRLRTPGWLPRPSRRT